MKRTFLLILLTAMALAAGGAGGWWLRGRHSVDSFYIGGDYYDMGTLYTARAFWRTNLDLQIRLNDAHLPSSATGNARCFVVPQDSRLFEIVYYSGDPKAPNFPPQLKEELRDLAIKRLAEITAEDGPGSEPSPFPHAAPAGGEAGR